MKKFILPILCIMLASACSQPRQINVVPNPQSIELHSGIFKAAGASVSYDASLDELSQQHVVDFAHQLTMLTGKTSNVSDNMSLKGFRFSIDSSLDPEGYTIEISRKNVVVKGADFHGILYAINTIGQMFPPSFFGTVPALGEDWTLPCATIQDKPRFAYRGVMKDDGRHFFGVEGAKRYIDIMALHKMNTLHWHLTEDQGWRIEIKKYPKLTEIGAFRDSTMIGKDWNSFDGKRYGGFYTQDEIREIVKYAEYNGITIIPEIDLPGHMVAAIASYPWLGCTGEQYQVRTKWGISDEVLCVGKESTFTFLEDVLTELIDLFPSEYIHIGGDECPKGHWEKCPACQAKIRQLGFKDQDGLTKEQYLQSYVTNRIEKFLADHGRKIIGWDEILEGEISKSATVMSWRGVKGGVKAAGMGHDVIMTPNTYMYIDYYQGDKDLEPLAIGGNLPIDTVYSYEPYTGLSEDAQKHILGVQCNLWTEYIETQEYLEYMLLPRMTAASEVQWCNADNKDFDRFKNALSEHICKIYDIRGYTYSKNIFGEPGFPGYERPDGAK